MKDVDAGLDEVGEEGAVVAAAVQPPVHSEVVDRPADTPVVGLDELDEVLRAHHGLALVPEVVARPEAVGTEKVRGRAEGALVMVT